MQNILLVINKALAREEMAKHRARSTGLEDGAAPIEFVFRSGSAPAAVYTNDAAANAPAVVCTNDARGCDIYCGVRACHLHHSR